MATDSILPVQLSRRKTADPSRRQRILQERKSERNAGRREERGRWRGEREEEEEEPRRVVSSLPPPTATHSHHHQSPVKRRRRRERERDSRLLEEEEGREQERPDISSPDNAESKITPLSLSLSDLSLSLSLTRSLTCSLTRARKHKRTHTHAHTHAHTTLFQNLSLPFSHMSQYSAVGNHYRVMMSWMLYLAA